MGYRVFYINQNQTYFATIRSGTAVGELITYVLNDLSEYKFVDMHGFNRGNIMRPHFQQ